MSRSGSGIVNASLTPQLIDDFLVAVDDAVCVIGVAS